MKLFKRGTVRSRMEVIDRHGVFDRFQSRPSDRRYS